ncbi:hypothetical protein ACWEO1_06395 [Kitasatospora cineracea]
MAKSSTIPRPTEAAALGAVQLRRPQLLSLYEALALTVRLRDRAGARLLRHLIAQTAAGGQLGEA